MKRTAFLDIFDKIGLETKGGEGDRGDFPLPFFKALGAFSPSSPLTV